MKVYISLCCIIMSLNIVLGLLLISVGNRGFLIVKVEYLYRARALIGLFPPQVQALLH